MLRLQNLSWPLVLIQLVAPWQVSNLNAICLICIALRVTDQFMLYSSTGRMDPKLVLLTLKMDTLNYAFFKFPSLNLGLSKTEWVSNFSLSNLTAPPDVVVNWITTAGVNTYNAKVLITGGNTNKNNCS